MKVSYPISWDDQDNLERPSKGWLDGVVVTLENGKEFNLCFYDPVRLKQEFDQEISHGKAGVIEKGLIIIPSVTKENIEMAVKQANDEGYFE